MLKNLGFLALGLTLGLTILLFNRSPDPKAPLGVPAEYDQVMTDVRDQLQNLTVRFSELEVRVRELAERPGMPTSRPEIASSSTASRNSRVVIQPTQNAQAVVVSRMPGPDELIEQLVAAGFSRQRAEWIAQRSEQFMMELIQARYESERTGEPLQPVLDPQASLRRELGDSEYERYLGAIGRETTVSVTGVLDNSPGAQAGLRQGDKIVSYGGQRVFDFREIAPLTLQGARGESVIIEILREGQPLRLAIPRGPLGASLSSDLGNPR